MNNFRLLLALVLLYGTPTLAQDKKAASADKGKAGKGEEAKKSDDALEAGAEYLCESEIFYSWKKALPSKKKMPAKKGADPEVGMETEYGAPKEEFFATVGENGQVKLEVAHRLQVKIPSIQEDAISRCLSIHQNVTSCIASGLESTENQYDRLDFSLRKKLLDSIKERCTDDNGVCLTSRSTEIKCHVARPPQSKKTEAVVGEKEKAGGKDKTAAKK